MRLLKYIWLIIMAMALSPTDVIAASNTAVITVSARVLTVVEKTVLRQTSVINVTAEDIERGYADVPRGTILEVKTNSRDGYLLYIETIGDYFGEVWISDGAKTTVVGQGSAFVHEPNMTGRVFSDVLELSYRFYLTRLAAAGSYPWPIVLDVVAH